MRVFFAHPKAWDDELIDVAVQEVGASIAADTGKIPEVIAGRDDFQKNIAVEGHFNGWCRSISRRTDSLGKRWYDLVVVPKADGIGKATAAIVSDCLRSGLPCAEVEFTDDDGLVVRPIVAIDTEDDENFTSGWHIVTGH